MDAVKAEKTSAMRRYRRIRQIATLFRCVEACAALALLSWFSSRLPLALRVSGAFLRQLSAILLSPRFVFLLGNAIVLTLFAKSGHFTPSSSSQSSSTPDGSGSGNLYDEIVKNADKHHPAILSSPQPNREEEADVVYEDKAVCVESIPSPVFRRTMSENIQLPKKPPPLRRSETDVHKNVEAPKGKKDPPPSAATVERENQKEMSNEEFRQTIEAFIAKQLRFQREESLGVMITAG